MVFRYFWKNLNFKICIVLSQLAFWAIYNLFLSYAVGLQLNQIFNFEFTPKIGGLLSSKNW